MHEHQIAAAVNLQSGWELYVWQKIAANKVDVRDRQGQVLDHSVVCRSLPQRWRMSK